jgi:phage gpG-like protein
MASIIEIHHQSTTDALERLAARLTHIQPYLAALGEDMAERTKQRFATTTAPDGSTWAANSPVTLARYIMSRGGASKKTGKVLAKGRALAAAKKPLQGKTGDLARQIFYQADEDQMSLGSSMIYAAMQQFGGSRARFPNLWGDIPSRRFLPITLAGELEQSEADWMVEQLQSYLAE